MVMCTNACLMNELKVRMQIELKVCSCLTEAEVG